MGKYTKAMQRTGLGIPGRTTCPSADEIPYLLELTHDADERVRRRPLKHLCPCRVRRRYDEVWDRIFEMAGDPRPGVRKDAVHALTDGSPKELVFRVLAQLEEMRRDPDDDVRRYVNRTINAYRRHGRVNVN